MFRKTLRAASAATVFSLASPPNGKLSSLFNRNSRSYFSIADLKNYVPTVVVSMRRLEKFLQTEGKSGDVSADEAFRLYEGMMQTEPKFDLYSFNLLLDGLAKHKRCCDVLSLFGKMDSVWLTPDLVTLNILLNCLCNANRARDAFLVLGRILRKGYSLDIVTFNSLIKGLFIGNRVYDAVLLFSNLEKFDCHPDEITYQTLYRGLDVVSSDKIWKLPDIDYPIGDIFHRMPNWRPSRLHMVACNLLVYHAVKGQEKLKPSIHSKNTCLDWKTLRDQLNRKLEEEILIPKVIEDVLGPHTFEGVCPP